MLIYKYLTLYSRATFSISKIFKYCPHCASENIEWKDEHCIKCQTCKFIYYHNQAAAVCVIVRHQEKILLTTRKKDPAKNSWDLPGGFVDPNEDAAQAAIRELKEETGLHIQADRLHYFSTAPNEYLYEDILYKTLDITFVTEIISIDEVHIADPNEIKALFWIHPQDIDLNKVGFKSTRETLHRYIKKPHIP